MPGCHNSATLPVLASRGCCPLTARELAVLSAIAEGLTLPQAAARLRIGRGTAANYVTAALEKLGTPNRTAAVVLALQQGWMCLDSIDVISVGADPLCETPR